MQLESKVPTPYATICFGDSSLSHEGCGKVYMTKEFYNRQMMAADSTWRCARCRMEAWWDDDNHDDWMDAEQAKMEDNLDGT